MVLNCNSSRSIVILTNRQPKMSCTNCKKWYNKSLPWQFSFRKAIKCGAANHRHHEECTIITSIVIARSAIPLSVSMDLLFGPTITLKHCISMKQHLFLQRRSYKMSTCLYQQLHSQMWKKEQSLRWGHCYYQTNNPSSHRYETAIIDFLVCTDHAEEQTQLTIWMDPWISTTVACDGSPFPLLDQN